MTNHTLVVAFGCHCIDGQSASTILNMAQHVSKNFSTWLNMTHHTLVEAVVLLLEACDSQSALVGLVSLLGKRQPTLSPPADRGGGGTRGGAGECHLHHYHHHRRHYDHLYHHHLLPHAPDVLLLWPQLDAGRIPNMNLKHQNCHKSIAIQLIQCVYFLNDQANIAWFTSTRDRTIVNTEMLETSK